MLAIRRPSLRSADCVALFALIVVWAVVALWWRKLPPQVPHHFGFDGEPDAWGSRSFVLILPALSLLAYLTRLPNSAPASARQFSDEFRAIILIGFAWSTIAVVRIGELPFQQLASNAHRDRFAQHGMHRLVRARTSHQPQRRK